ncbi:uncharacterized protein [Pocillopora verrucosa]|uniref:uncharacterized protein isoform X2 n=1 Tax=Pocillopora verrucosa TaxID=203993 RepID=UPI0033425DB8
MAQVEGGAIPKNRRNAPILINVLLLKKNNYHVVNGRICMPTQSEMSTIRRSDELQQFKRDLEIGADMSDDMVKALLEATFPYLKGRRFSCAAVVRIDEDHSKFEDYGQPRVWDSNFIRTKIKGNSTLYLLESLDSGSDSTSGISESEDNFASMPQNLDTLYPYEVQINPQRSPQEGGGPCVFTFTPKLSSVITSVSAVFDSVGKISLKMLLEDDECQCLGEIPASKEPGWVTITLRADQGPYKPVLGRTRIYYEKSPWEEFLEEIVFNTDKQKEFYETVISRRNGSSGNRESGGNGSGNSGGLNKRCGKQIGEAFGSSQPSHVLGILIYTAARYGAKEFIEIIFNSSAGGVLFNCYKDNATLPESVARDFGNDEIANYLEEITNRFSQEIQNGKQFSQTVDWSELVKATEEAQTKMNQDTDEKHANQVEGGYSADVELSSSASSDQENPDYDVLPSIEDLVYSENESEEKSVILKESNEESITSSAAMSMRTKDSATGSVVGKIDEAADVNASLDSFKIRIFDQPVESGQILSFRSSHSAPPTKIRFHANDGFNIFSAEFGDVKETTTEGDITSIVADKGQSCTFEFIEELTYVLDKMRWRPEYELVPTFLQTEEDQTDEKDAKS